MRRRILAVGGSAGAIEALQQLVAGLPADLDACVLVSVHVSPSARSQLPQILSRCGPLPAEHARDGEPLRPNTILVAPPDRHLLSTSWTARLSNGPKVNRHRPSIDVMFASVAHWAGPDAVAVALSGTLDDGAVGAALVSRAGGTVFVQDPADALFTGIPRAALTAVPSAVIGPAAQLGAAVSGAIRAGKREVAEAGSVDGWEGASMVSMADSGDPAFLAAGETRLTRLVCPDCHGSLAQVDLPTISYFRCHVGHQWSPQTLAAAQAETAEDKLWSALAALEEQAALARHLAQAHGPDHEPDADTAGRHLRAAERAAELAETLRTHLGG